MFSSSRNYPAGLNGKFNGECAESLTTGISPIYPDVAILTSQCCHEFNVGSVRVVFGLCLKYKKLFEAGTLCKEGDVQTCVTATSKTAACSQ